MLRTSNLQPPLLSKLFLRDDHETVLKIKYVIKMSKLSTLGINLVCAVLNTNLCDELFREIQIAASKHSGHLQEGDV